MRCWCVLLPLPELFGQIKPFICPNIQTYSWLINHSERKQPPCESRVSITGSGFNSLLHTPPTASVSTTSLRQCIIKWIVEIKYMYWIPIIIMQLCLDILQLKYTQLQVCSGCTAVVFRQTAAEVHTNCRCVQAALQLCLDRQQLMYIQTAADVHTNCCWCTYKLQLMYIQTVVVFNYTAVVFRQTVADVRTNCSCVQLDCSCVFWQTAADVQANCSCVQTDCSWCSDR